MAEVVALIAVALGGFFIRTFPRFGNWYKVCYDTSFHLFVADRLRESRGKVDYSKIVTSVRNTEFDYPIFYHKILAVIPKSWVPKAEAFTGAIFDLVTAALAAYLAFYLGADSSAVLAFALVLFCPGLLRTGAGPRSFSGSPRVFAQAVYNLHLISFFLWGETGNIWFGVITVGASSLVFLSAKFAIQVLLLFSPGYVLFYSWDYGVVIVVGFALSILISKGYAWKSFKASLSHMAFFRRHLQKQFLEPHHQSFRQYAEGFLGAFRSKGIKGGMLYFVSNSHPAHVFFLIFPHGILFVVIIAQLWQAQPIFNDFNFLLVWFIMGSALCFLTRTKDLLFLGEGERYLEYSILPVAVLLVLLPIAHSILWLIAVMGCGVGIVSIILYSSGQIRTFDYQSFLKKTPPDLEAGNVMCIGGSDWRVMQILKFPVLSPGVNFDLKKFSSEEVSLFISKYPFVNGSLFELIKSKEIRYLFYGEQDLRNWAAALNENEESLEQVGECIVKDGEWNLVEVNEMYRSNGPG